MRIAIAGVSIECCTFSPLDTGYDDFIHLRGDDILVQFSFLSEAAGEHEIVPIQWSRSVPGGMVEEEAYRRIEEDILTGIQRAMQAGRLDGVYLLMHGAMYVRGMEDAEGGFYATLREVVGDECIIGASYDLHGNISEGVFQYIDINTAYRKAPHTDAAETRERGFRLLCTVLEEGRLPHKAWIPVPMVLPGEVTSTDWEPGRSVYSIIDEVVDRPGILDASICIGYVWADEPRSRAGVLAYGSDPEAVEGGAVDLASKVWDARCEFRFGVPHSSAEECIRWAMRDVENAESHPVIISDSGDNPTAGGVGDVTHTLEKLLKADPEGAVFASIPDRAAIAECVKAGTGAAVTLSLGGKLDPIHGNELIVTGRVTAIIREKRGSSGGRNGRTGQTQIVLTAGNVRIIITERRTPFHYLRQFEALGIEPTECQIIVVKIGYLVPELQKAAKKAYLVLSPGAVDQDIVRLPFKRIVRPVFPLDRNIEFFPGTELRTGGGANGRRSERKEERTEGGMMHTYTGLYELSNGIPDRDEVDAISPGDPPPRTARDLYLLRSRMYTHLR